MFSAPNCSEEGERRLGSRSDKGPRARAESFTGITAPTTSELEADEETEEEIDDDDKQEVDEEEDFATTGAEDENESRCCWG